MTYNPYERDLDQNEANFVALSPISMIERTASIYPNKMAVVHGDIRRTWSETLTRCRQLGDALVKSGVQKGDTVSFMAANTPELYEAHFGVALSGGVLNALNTRLDSAAIAFILNHAKTKYLFTDLEFSGIIRDAMKLVHHDMVVIDIVDSQFEGGERLSDTTYEEFIATGDGTQEGLRPASEWDAISLNYTSGTTGNPKGVVYHHRGAYLNAMSNVISWGMDKSAKYLWTLPMFHCNGWCFPWTIAAIGGTNVCLRQVRVEPIYDALKNEKVTHFCGAPIVLNMLNNVSDEMKEGINHQVKVMTAGAAPPAAVIEGMERMGFDVTHVYGLTETYGPSVQCVWHDEWDDKPLIEKAALKARQGVRGPVLEGLMVADPETLEPRPKDGETIGEIFMRGNNVMKGYLENPGASEEAFEGGWFHSGDLAVWHEDGYLEIKDRSKDIIISGGENISSIEIEDTLYGHPSVMEAAVVARPDEKWGETPCAFIALKPGGEASEKEIISYCREHMAHFKTPRSVVFGELPKTSTGKIQKFILRKQAQELGSLN